MASSIRRWRTTADTLTTIFREDRFKIKYSSFVKTPRGWGCVLGLWRGPKKIKHFLAWRIVVQVNRIPNGAARGFRSPRDSTMNGHGGKRPGAGRPKGAASRANEEVRQETAATRGAGAMLKAAIKARSEPAGRPA